MTKTVSKDLNQVPVTSMKDYYQRYFPGRMATEALSESDPSRIGKKLAREARGILQDMLSRDDRKGN